MAAKATTGAKRERTCIGCGAKAGKSGLLRIVRGADGSVGFDATGRAAGRGAYVCSPVCFEAAVKEGKLSRALRVRVDAVAAERISRHIAQVEVGEASA